jgi:hypothetical protein
MTDQRIDTDDWFEVDFDNTSDGVEDEAELTGAPAALLRKLRERVPTWQQLGVASPDTVGWYTDGRLHVLVTLYDRPGKMTIGCLRLEIAAADWRAGWVSTSLSDHDDFFVAGPADVVSGEVSDESAAADRLAGWLEEQLRRPVVRRYWRTGGEIVARSWRLEDSGRELVVTGAPGLTDNVRAADETVDVRP